MSHAFVPDPQVDQLEDSGLLCVCVCVCESDRERESVFLTFLSTLSDSVLLRSAASSPSSLSPSEGRDQDHEEYTLCACLSVCLYESVWCRCVCVV